MWRKEWLPTLTPIRTHISWMERDSHGEVDGVNQTTAFPGSISSDAAWMAYRELDRALNSTEMTTERPQGTAGCAGRFAAALGVFESCSV
jgi:hypothetical protein